MAGCKFYNPFVCDFEYHAAGGKYHPCEFAQCNRCESFFGVDATELKDHVTLVHGELLPPSYFKAIVGLDAHIPGHESIVVKPSGCAWHGLQR